MKFLLSCFATLIAIGLAAADAEVNRLPDEVVAGLKSPKKVTLFSLEPEIDRPGNAPKPVPAESHHGFKVLGNTELATDAQTVAIEAVTKAVATFDGEMARCFEPRHSLQVITDKGVTYDLVICFQCDQLRIFKDDKNLGSVGLTAPSKALDELLAHAKVPISKPSK